MSLIISVLFSLNLKGFVNIPKPYTGKNEQNNHEYAVLITIANYKYASIKRVLYSLFNIDTEKVRCSYDKDTGEIRMRISVNFAYVLT